MAETGWHIMAAAMAYYYQLAGSPPHVRILASGVLDAAEWRSLVTQILVDARVARGLPVLLETESARFVSLSADLIDAADGWRRLAARHPVGLVVSPGVAAAVADQLARLVPGLAVMTRSEEVAAWLDRGSGIGAAAPIGPPAEPAADDVRRPRAIHVSAAPEETYLLGLQLESEGIELRVTAASTHHGLAAALAEGASLLIADLPLPWPGADQELNDLQRLRPDVPVVFRSGSAGQWNIEDGGGQLGRAVRQALAISPETTQSPEQRRAILREVTRYQQAHLALSQLDLWEPAETLRTALEIMADTAGVERVSVWRLTGDRDQLHCEALFERSSRRHTNGATLRLESTYHLALETATFVAAHDAVRDPRTSAFARDYLVPHGIGAMLDAPVRSKGRIVGVVCLEHVGSPRRWNVVEQCAAAAFAGTVGRIVDWRERRRIDEEWQEARRLDLVGRMAGAVAHDFGNLATVINGFSEALLDDCAPGDPRREALEAVREAGRSASALVKQLLAFARAQPTEARPIELGRELRALEPLLQRLLGSSIRLVIGHEGPEWWIHMDPVQFQQVILNLAANARDAMPRGGTFTLQLDAVGPEPTASRESYVRLRALDEGEGIPAAALADLFKPFFTTKGALGTGLGLTTVQAIVRQAGGVVAVESSARGATCFAVTLPRIEPPSTRPATVSVAAAPPLRVAGDVLVVDDDPAVCGLIARVVARLGCEVHSAGSAKAGVDVAQALGERLRLVVTDFTMRGMNGLELVQTLRRRRPDLPALIVTGHVDVEPLAAFASNDWSQILGKPFDAGTLTERVRRLLAGAPRDALPAATTDAPRPVVVLQEPGVGRNLIVAVLSGAGFEVTAVEQGEQAVQLLESASRRTALLIDGPLASPSLLERLRARPRDVRVAVLGSTRGADDARVAGLPKPFSPTDLLATVESLWSREPERDSARASQKEAARPDEPGR